MAASSNTTPRIAVLYQAVDPPVVNGVRKPMKPGGYKDSSADIAHCLMRTATDTGGIKVITPVPNPDPTSDYDWCFPDTEAGILDAVEAHGATHLWANTILFASHPLQTSPAIGRLAAAAGKIKLVGQPPCLVEHFDDKELVNDMLRAAGGFTMPRGWTLTEPTDAGGNGGGELSATTSLREYISSLSLPYPVVGKPIRGRGSHGVRVCANLDEMVDHAAALFRESPRFMVEEYLAGEEGTVTVMPPVRKSADATGKNGDPSHETRRTGYWALPVVQRYNHQAGIAPYNGVVAVSANSRAVTADESLRDPAYAMVQKECERAAEMLQPTAPIRIDVRRRKGERSGDGGVEKFCLFDVNVKPNLTGPGRPGRDDQACLTLLAAEALGWDYARLLLEMLDTALPLDEIRSQRPNGVAP